MALVVYRFLTRAGAAPPVAASAEVEVEVAGAVAADAADDVVAGDPDERIEVLRRKLEAARVAPASEPPSAPAGPAAPAAPAEPPLDERRRAVHAAGRDAADAMRRAGERLGRSEQPGPDDPAG